MALRSRPGAAPAPVPRSERLRARAREAMRLQVRTHSGEMEVEIRSRLAAARKARETRARGKARVATAFKATAGLVAEFHFLCLQLGAAGLVCDLFGGWRIVSSGGFGRLVLLRELRR